MLVQSIQTELRTVAFVLPLKAILAVCDCVGSNEKRKKKKRKAWSLPWSEPA